LTGQDPAGTPSAPLVAVTVKRFVVGLGRRYASVLALRVIDETDRRQVGLQN
jgi:hypothetical protein